MDQHANGAAAMPAIVAPAILRSDDALPRSDARLRLLVDGIQDYAIVLLDPIGRVVTWNRGAQCLKGYTEAEILGRSMTVFYPPEAVAAGLPERLLAQAMIHGRTEEEGWRVHKDGSRFFAEVVVRPIYDADGRLLGFAQVTRNIFERKQAEQSLRLSEARYRLLAEHSTDVIMWVGPDGTRLYVSAASRRLFGYEPAELIGRPVGGLVHPDDRAALPEMELLRQGTLGDAVTETTYRCIHKDGSVIWVEAFRRQLPDGHGYVATIRDVSERKRLQDQLTETNRHLQHLARRDELTGLANRRAFDEAIHTEVLRATRDGTTLSVVLIDVDHFKQFNDRYGHPAGDDCLRAIARAIESVLCRPGDLAARYGGEEFAMLLPNTAEAGAATVAQRLLEAVRELRIAHDGSPELIVTISAGLTTFWPRRCPGEPTELVRRADTQLYRAKQEGRNRFFA